MTTFVLCPHQHAVIFCAILTYLFYDELHGTSNESGQARQSLSPLGMKTDMTTFIDLR